MKYKRIFVLAVLILLAFIIGFLLGNNKWQCPACASPEGDITPLINEEYYPVLINEIENANSNIDIVIYEFKWYDNNNSVVQLRNLLAQRAEDGIKIRIILDQSKWYGQITDLSEENNKTGNWLAERGVYVKLDSLKTTTHDKLVIIDDNTVLVGSHNWGSSALTKNNEASVMIKGKEVAEFYENYFEYLWANQ
jgi:phosphatidylserine/phosphatidylglycerophosphate/cardiolipin synthase-like enzyme